MDEHELLALLRAHDERGMRELLRRCGPLMRYILTPILSDPREREECLSDCAMRVWEKIDRYDEHSGSFTAWLSAVVRNTARNRARSQRAAAQELPEDYPAPDNSPESETLRRERTAALAQALAALSARDRALFYRKYYYLQPMSQIAAELGLTERAAEGRLYRLRRKLRAALGGDCRE